MGLFRDWFSPGSHWKFQRGAGQGLWTRARPCCLPWSRAQRSLSGSGKLLDFPVAFALARKRNPSPAPPARPDRTSRVGVGTPTHHTRTANSPRPDSPAAGEGGVVLRDILQHFCALAARARQPRGCAPTVCLSSRGGGAVLLLCACQPRGKGREKRGRWRGLLRARARQLQPSEVMGVSAEKFSTSVQATQLIPAELGANSWRPGKAGWWGGRRAPPVGR